MGVKFLSLRLIPWCLHPLMGMGSYVSCVHLRHGRNSVSAAKKIIKLIKSDGEVKVYDRPVYVSDLMLEFPKHMVCRSDSLYIGQKVPALSGEDQLQLGHNYFLLPKHFFQSVLSFVTLASFASVSQQRKQFQSSSCKDSSSKNVFVKKTANCRPFDIQKTSSGCLRIRVSEEFISQLMEQAGQIEEEDDQIMKNSANMKNSKLCTTQQLQRDYSMLVGSSAMKWKPKLESIRENRDHRKKFSSFAMKRNKKSQPSTTTKKITAQPTTTVVATAGKKTSKKTFKYNPKHVLPKPYSKSKSH